MGRGKHKQIREYSKTVVDLLAEGMKKKEEALKLIKIVTGNVNEAKKSGLDASKIAELLTKAKDKIDSAKDLSDYDEAISDLNSAIKIFSDSKKRSEMADNKITAVKKLFTGLEKRNIIDLGAKKQIMMAESALKKKDFKKAYKIAESTFKKLEETKNNYQKASDIVKQAHVKIADAKSIEADAAAAESLYNEALSNMEKNEYQTAVKLAQKSKDTAEKAIAIFQERVSQQMSDNIDDLQNEIGKIKELGADITKPDNILVQVKAAFEKKEYKAVSDNIEKCRNTISEARNQYQVGEDKLSQVRGAVKDAESAEIDIAEIKINIKNVETALAKYDYENAEAIGSSILKEIEMKRMQHRKLLGLKEQAEDLLNTVRSNVNELKDIGIITADAEDFIKKAGSALANQDYFLSQQHSNNAIGKCKELQGVYTRAAGEVQKAQSLISDFRAFIDTTEAEENVEQSKNRLDKGYYTEALDMAASLINKMETIKTNESPVLKFKQEDVPTLKSGAWSKLQLEIENDGKVHADEIKLDIPEELESRGFLTLPSIKAGERKTLDISLRTSEIGEIPVNIGISFKNPITSEQLGSQEVLWIKAEPGEFGMAPEPKQPSTDEVKTPQVEGEVVVLSEIEFFQGYIRLKVGIKNEMKTVITEAKLDVEFDESTIRLDFIEPEFDRRGNRIVFGVIQPNDKRTVALHLDPLICTESSIDGTLTYKDVYGELKTSAMKRRRAEVVCPILYTTENINTAMLKRLVNDELKVHDNKIYEIPPGIDFKRASEISRDTIQGHDLKLVREFVEHDVDDPEIETWYYGLTKVKKHKVVVKASSRQKTNTIELLVASLDKKVLTGFLAELGHNLNDKLKEMGLTKVSIFPITDNITREEIAQTQTLLNHNLPDKTILSISKRGDEYEVGFRTSEKKDEAAEVYEFIKVSPDSRKDIIIQIGEIVTLLNIFSPNRGSTPALQREGGDEQEQECVTKEKVFSLEKKYENLSEFGRLLYGIFLPVNIQKHIESLNEPIILKTNDNEIPWELLHDNDDFLCLKVPVGRRLRSREIARVNQYKKGDKTRFLFIVNPTDDLPGSEEELDYILSNLSPDVEVDVLKSHAVTTGTVLAAFRSGKYDIIHYAGHAEFNPRSPDESALICTNKSRIYAQEIKRVLGGRPFVFLNACGSGKEVICEDGVNYSGSDTEGLASSFILGGALAFIGSSWSMPDISAGILSVEFYKNVLTGVNIGEALRLARVHLKKERPKDINWMAFTLFGDPTIKLAR